MARKKKIPERERESLAQKMSAMLDIPLEGISPGYCITVSGNEEVSVSGCRGVLAYTAEQIQLRTSKHNVYIRGSSLEVCSLIEDQIVIHGKIASVHLGKTEEEKL